MDRPVGRPHRLVPRPRRQHPLADAALLNWRGTPAARRSRSLRLPRWLSAPSSSPLSTTPSPPRWPATAAARSCPPSLRPYLIAALLEAEPDAPGLVVAADDRAARDLAADLRAWLSPRAVRYYPSRGVSYESHLAPPPHLVGLRIAALDALWARRRRRSSSSPPSRCPRRSPTPSCARTGSRIEKGELLDLEETAQELVAAGYERVDQVEDRGQFAIRGGMLDVYPATEERAVRVDLFGDEVESLRWFSTFTQRSLGEAERVEIAPAAELAPEHRELAEIAALEDADERPDVAELLPVDRFRAFLDLVPARATSMLAAEEDVDPALADHWQDVTAAFHDADAHHLYVAPERSAQRSTSAPACACPRIVQDQSVRFHAQSADTPARSLREAEAELEKLVRSGYRTVVAWPRRGEGERAAYNLAALQAAVARRRARARAASCASRRPRCARVHRARRSSSRCMPEHRLIRRRRAEARPRPRAAARCARFADLRTGDIVVHEDHGIARFAGFDTKTVAGVTRDYLELEYQGTDRVFMPVDQLAKISRYVGAGGAAPPLSQARRHGAGSA